MAATVTGFKLISGSVRKPADESFPWVMTTQWMARKLSDGSPAPATVEMNLASAVPLDQDHWDTLWSNVKAAYATLYSHTPAVSEDNPITEMPVPS